MNQKYPIYQIDREQRILEIEQEEALAGYQAKFWVDHPQLGRALVKFEESTAPAWSEKVVHEIAKLLKLPCARYELGQYNSNRYVVISPDFKNPNSNYLDADTFNRQTIDNFSYNLENSIELLDINEVGIGDRFLLPPGIETGSDLFTGYLILDSLIANNDRHGGNWEIAIDPIGNKTLAPVFDNGAAFATTFGSLIYDVQTPREYMERDMTMFGEKFFDIVAKLKELKSGATEIWLQQIGRIQPKDFQDIFDRVPEHRIDPKAKTFALKLIDHNRTRLMELRVNRSPAAKLSSRLAASKKRIELVPQLAATIKRQLDAANTNNLAVKSYRASWDSSVQKLTLSKREQPIAIAKLTAKQWESISIPPASIVLSDEDLEFWLDRETLSNDRVSRPSKKKSSSLELD